MSFFNLPVDDFKKSKPKSVHPWLKTIKDEFSPYIKLGHNSVKNVRYPKPKEKITSSKRVVFTVVGNRVTKEFIYCVNLVQGMHKYRSKKFGPPVIRAVTGVEWQSNTLRDLQIQYGSLAHCLQSQVAVIRNVELIGGEKELKELIENKYYINLLALDYQRESIKQFANFLKEIGLYSDIVPRTCENFLRLCQEKGGYNGAPVHRIVKDGWIQCGGFGLKNTEMDCENFIVNFDRRGVLGMANAGRHSDCSTQFFVLLQPNVCLKLRFVAFGQLIDGEETLKKIEAAETFYEAPLDNIIILRAGIVNLDCKDIRINKGAREYIDQHIDDLVIIGEIFYAMLLDNVFLEAEFRKLRSMEPPMPEGEQLGEEAFGDTIDEHGNYIPENIRATRRFIRKKEELQNENDDKEGQERNRISTVSRPSKVIKKPEGPSTVRRLSKIPNKTEAAPENNEFDVEDYEPEEYTYSQISGPSSTEPKPTYPYYLALTDVPYAGEVSSTFDLKRFLQGDYCLEADLNPKEAVINRAHRKWKWEQKMQAVSHIISSYGGSKWSIESSSSDSDESTSSGELDSDEEREIKEYLQQYGEKASFSGNQVKSIAKKYVSNNPVENKGSGEFWNDEEVRRMRLAMQDIENRTKKKVSISAQPWEYHKQIKRRMTGYVQNEDLYDDEEEEDDEKDDTLQQQRKVSVSITAPHNRSQRKIERRVTGFIPPPHLAKSLVKEENDDEDEEQRVQQKGGASGKSGVRIAPREMNTEQTLTPMASRKSMGDKAEMGLDKSRPSVLMRLYDDIAIDDNTPTLKDYKPVVTPHKRTFTLAEDLADNLLLRRSINVFQQQLTHKHSSITELPGRRSEEKKAMSVAYSSRPWTEILSINSVEYSRKRPTISVAQYQQKNKMEMEALAKELKEKAAKEKDQEAESNAYNSTRTGIRLPGDSPVYDISVRNLHNH